MDKDLHKDPLEEFFRKQLGGAEEPPSSGTGWDVPDDRLWGQIAEALPPPRRRPLWLLWLLPLCLAVGGLLWLYQQERVARQQQEQQVERLTQALATCGAGVLPEDGVGERAPAALPTAAPELAADNAAVPPARTAAHQQAPTAPLSTPHMLALSAAPPLPGIPQEAAGAHSLPSVPDTTEWREATAMAALPVRHALGVQRSPTLAPIAIWRPWAVTAAPAPAPRLAWVVGAYYGSAQNGRQIRPASGQVQPLFRGKEEFVRSAERGVLLGLQLSPRWRVETGASRHQFQHITRQNFRLAFRPDRETSTGSELGSTYALAVPSSYGDAEMEVDLRRDNAPLPSPLPGQQILGAVRTTQAFRVTTVPLVAAYRLNRHRLHVEAKTGLAFNWIEDQGFQAQVSLTRLDFRLRQVRVQRGFSDAARSSVDYVAGLSLRYEAWPGTALFVEPTFQRSLTPSAVNESFSTYGQRRALRLGLAHRF